MRTTTNNRFRWRVANQTATHVTAIFDPSLVTDQNRLVQLSPSSEMLDESQGEPLGLITEKQPNEHIDKTRTIHF